MERKKREQRLTIVGTVLFTSIILLCMATKFDLTNLSHRSQDRVGTIGFLVAIVGGYALTLISLDIYDWIVLKWRSRRGEDGF